MSVQLGLLTTADINGEILSARGANAPFEIAAVGSRDRARAEAYAAEHGIARAHGSYEELLADPKLDAVYIALPNVLHHEWAMRALEAGRHVLVEKPYTRVPAQVDEAQDLADAKGLVLEEAFMWRHSVRAKQLPRAVQTVHCTFFGILPREHDVRYEAELGGGALLDLGCYCVSAARLIAGSEPDRVYGEADMQGGVDMRFTGTLRFGDLVVTFACGFTGHANRIQLAGVDGVVEVDTVFSEPTAYRAELNAFCAAIRGEPALRLGRTDMLGQARALDALLRSAETRAPVEL